MDGQADATRHGSLRQWLFTALCLVLAVSAWLALRATVPLPAVSGLVDARADKTRNDFAIVLNVRDAGTHGHARLTWSGRQSEADRQTLSFGHYSEGIGH